MPEQRMCWTCITEKKRNSCSRINPYSIQFNSVFFALIIPFHKQLTMYTYPKEFAYSKAKEIYVYTKYNIDFFRSANLNTLRSVCIYLGRCSKKYSVSTVSF